MNPSQTLPPVVFNMCRSVFEGRAEPVDLSSATVQRLQLALEAGAAIPYMAEDGTVLLVVRPPKPGIEGIKERLEGMTPGQHRIALTRIAAVLSNVEKADTGDVAQVKAWLAEGFRVRHSAWGVKEWIHLEGSGCLLDENGHVLDADSFFPEQSAARGQWEIVP